MGHRIIIFFVYLYNIFNKKHFSLIATKNTRVKMLATIQCDRKRGVASED